MYGDNFPRLGRLVMCCAGLAFCSAGLAADDVLVHGKLRWTKEDNGQDIKLDDAAAFCARRGAGWRLPHVGELAALHAEGGGMPAFRLSGNWFWTDTPVTSEEAAKFEHLGWGVVLSNGRRTQTFKFMSFGSRALCVQAL